MKSTHLLELADIKAIAAAAEAEALKNQWAVTIAIADAGGHLLWLQRLDGAPPVSAHIAPAKAHTAALGRRDTRVYEEVINGGRVSFLSAPEIRGMLEGGVPIIKDGTCLGAVGVNQHLHDHLALFAQTAALGRVGGPRVTQVIGVARGPLDASRRDPRAHRGGRGASNRQG